MLDQIFSQLGKSKKLSQLRQDFLEKIKNNEINGNYEKELLYYRAEIRTLELTLKIYKNFKEFLSKELSNPEFKKLYISKSKLSIENKATYILLKFKEIFSDLSIPHGELDQLINFISLEIDELNRFQNSPEYIRDKIIEIQEISQEEKSIEVFEENIIKKIELFLKETNINKKEINNFLKIIQKGGNLTVKAGEKLEEKASLFALTVVTLGLISSVGSSLGIPGVAVFGTLFSSVAFGGELLQSIPWLKKYIETHRLIHKEFEEKKDELYKLDK